MKKAALYILLFSYATIMLKPVMPYVSDLVAHVFYYSQHMATVHYENGKLHVHKEIVDEAKKTGPAKETPFSKKENSANDHIVMLQKNIFHCFEMIYFHVSSSPGPVYQDHQADYPPPKA